MAIPPTRVHLPLCKAGAPGSGYNPLKEPSRAMPEVTPPDARIDALLNQLSHAANLGVSPEELLKRAMDGLLQVTRARAGVACLADPEGKTLGVVSIRGVRPAVIQTLPQAFRLEVKRGSEQVRRPIRIGEAEFPGLEELHARLRAEGITGGVLLPLSSDGRLLGLLMAMSRAGDDLPPALSDASLDAIQREISTALQNARVRHGLQSLNMDLLRLLTLAKILGEPRELEDALTMVAQAARSFAGAVTASVWLADPATKRLTRLVLLAPEGPRRDRPMHLAYGEGVPGWVAETGQALYLDEAPADPRVVGKEWLRGLGIRGIYAFPLHFKQALVGILSVATAAPLPPSQLSLFGNYCDHAALAIGYAGLLRDKDVHVEQLGELVAVAQALNKRRPRQTLLRLISEACRRATGAPWFAVWAADGRKRQLRLLHSDPVKHGPPGRPKPIAYGSGLVGWAALHRRTRVTPDVSHDPLAGDPGWYRGRGIVASVALPLVVSRTLVGVLHLGTQAPLEPEQLRLVEGYAALTAASIAP